MSNSFLAIPFVLHLIATSGGGVPTLDVRPSCRAAAAAQITNTDRMQACMGNEQDARDRLVRTSNQLTPSYSRVSKWQMT
jgi:hypothetical protein